MAGNSHNAIASTGGEKHPYTLPDEPSFWKEEHMDNLTALSKCGSIRDYLRRHQHKD